MTRLVLRRAETAPGVTHDVVLQDGRIASMGEGVPRAVGDEEIDARGGALLRGLHDHHIHLFALAAAWQSVACGPPDVEDADALARALCDAPVREWIRGVGYHESVAGPLDRDALDALGPADVPTRIQHRTGVMWFLNSAAIDRIVDAGRALPPGVECDASGRPTGRIQTEDAWLRERLGTAAFPDLAPVGRFLAECGVTAVTDATPEKDAATFDALDAAMCSGALPQHVVAMGGLDHAPPPESQVEAGAHKIMLRESALPSFDDLVARIERAHAQDRGAAFHCVTRAELVLAAEALREAGVQRGDRIEHASIAPDEIAALLAGLGVAVVTQPGFVYERGDIYLREVEPADRPFLYRGRGFLAAGVALGGGTDAPYGDADPWVGIRAAVDRKTRAGARLGIEEGLGPERALALFTSPLDAPGQVPAPLAVGDEADLCLLDLPWAQARESLERDRVCATLRAGRILYRREAL